ncbi:hypothetical protein ES703_74243 [subsurface metagenome]
MKILFFVGKGGVGKSTNAALFALKLARSGKKVILNSIDPAHNLGDIFQVPLGRKPKELLSGLSVMETDLNQWVKRYLKETESDFKKVYKYQEVFNLHKYFKTLKYSPGLEEYAVLLSLVDTVQKNSSKDYIIFDTPPTALTLKFFALPSVSLLWLRELIKFRHIILDKKEIITRIKTAKRRAAVEKDHIMSKIESLIKTYEEFSALLKNIATTRVFVVLNPDKLSLAETCTICSELENLGIGVPLMILNKYGGEEEFFKELEGHYKKSRILKLDKQDEEITGIQALDSLSLPMALDEI